ncbi:hypothetical protein [Methanocorpusculum vombati]|uniref:Uncharacterized protein n=1 Tax=Methanocorpusculum vombati TaxID=3002864 RepID=A0ABT4IL53_9EURY|nr:hypothetical protein [Methanocorpusculum vombati]MCZ9319572.1 hypothetical protein [Methanocorpusculum sp.]MCZ0862261.1 hypothetical protein [Methanocorpusculum vombati]MDE2519741.1 hypothetical protein [Methanocorpusculum sp.]MDE2534479.1 hypothetical protein [Methanocorpusculum sp.]MDE2545202.1 hypothetical protein [Methanocorpusculum sp.]
MTEKRKLYDKISISTETTKLLLAYRQKLMDTQPPPDTPLSMNALVRSAVIFALGSVP